MAVCATCAYFKVVVGSSEGGYCTYHNHSQSTGSSSSESNSEVFNEIINELIENRIYHDGFLESRGWNIYHVWTRDWWNNKNKVISSIVREIEKSKRESEDSRQSKVVSSRR